MIDHSEENGYKMHVSGRHIKMYIHRKENKQLRKKTNCLMTATTEENQLGLV